MEQMAHRAAAHEIDKSKYVGIIWRPAEYGGDGRAQRTAVRRNYGQEFIALGHVGDNSQEESHSASVEQNVAHGVQCVARSTRRGLLRLTVGCFENRQEQIVDAWEIVGDVRLAKARSEERRVGKEWVSTCRFRGTPDH